MLEYYQIPKKLSTKNIEFNLDLTQIEKYFAILKKAILS